MARGGKRPGAGRPVGTPNKKSLLDYWTKADIDEYFEYLKDAYKESDKLNQFVGEHLMGKASQPIEGELKAALTITFDPTFDATTRETERNSTK
jgi:hypothetical protein